MKFEWLCQVTQQSFQKAKVHATTKHNMEASMFPTWTVLETSLYSAKGFTALKSKHKSVFW